jgi:hypothetical protein
VRFGDLVGHPAVLDVVLFTVAEGPNRQFRDRQGVDRGLNLLLAGEILPPVALREEPVILLPRLRGAVLPQKDHKALVLDLGLAARLVELVGGRFMHQPPHDLEPSKSTAGFDHPVGIQAQVALPTIGRCHNLLLANCLQSVGATGFEPVTSSTPSACEDNCSATKPMSCL